MSSGLSVLIRTFGAACLAAVLACPALARADIYGFVDDAGVTHFSTEPIDVRYQLFFKEGEHPSDLAAAKPFSQDRSLTQSRLFQRVVEQPNVEKYASLIATVAREQNQDPALLKSVIAVESAFEPNAVSSKGAIGLMQVMPETAERYGLAPDRKQSVEQKLRDPGINLRIGAHYLKDLRDAFGSLNLALAAYNAGENSVRRFNNQIPPFPETVSYVKVVQQFLAFYQPLRSLYLNGANGRTHVILPGRRNMPESVTGDVAPLIIPDDIAEHVSVQDIP
jgi:hypothetical protein